VSRRAVAPSLARARLATVDVGNSTCKVVLWRARGRDAPRRVARARFATDAALRSSLASWIRARAGRRDGPGVALSCVAGRGLERSISRELARAFGERFLGAPDPGLAIACREPERVGRDRLYAARGALEVAGGPSLVVDAGTALTVDALAVRRGRGRFLGGAIAPGPALLARALAQGTARLPLVDVARTRARSLGRDTREAIASGVVHGFRGAARELARAIGRESGVGERRIVITGGARSRLVAPPLFGARAVTEVEDLVHVGLAAAALDLIARRRAP
jgi:type III pantothenate kinase